MKGDGWRQASSLPPVDHQPKPVQATDNRLTIPSLLALTLFTDTYAYVTQ